MVTTAAGLRIDFRAMYGNIGVLVDGEHGVENVGEVMAWFADWERRFSRFLPRSELSQLNADPAETVAVSPLLFEVLSTALYAAHVTDGLVTPTVLDALERAGYAHSYELLAAVTKANPRRAPVPAQDHRSIRLSPAQRTVTRPPGLRLDLSGTVKGWAADRTAARLAGHGAVLIDADGDIAVTGPRADGSAWPITIACPRQGDEALGVLPLRSGGIATCAPARRRWQQGDSVQHHIIDPRSGAPAANDVRSATVVAPSASEAEAAAKAVVLLGSVDGIAWLEQQPAYAGLIVRHDGELVRSSRLAAFAPADSFAPLP